MSVGISEAVAAAPARLKATADELATHLRAAKDALAGVLSAETAAAAEVGVANLKRGHSALFVALCGLRADIQDLSNAINGGRSSGMVEKAAPLPLNGWRKDAAQAELELVDVQKLRANDREAGE